MGTTIRIGLIRYFRIFRQGFQRQRLLVNPPQRLVKVQRAERKSQSNRQDVQLSQGFLITFKQGLELKINLLAAIYFVLLCEAHALKPEGSTLK